MSVLADWRLEPPEDGPEEVTDHDLYMEAVMADDVCPHVDFDEYVVGDRAVDDQCTSCGALASTLRRAS